MPWEWCHKLYDIDGFSSPLGKRWRTHNNHKWVFHFTIEIKLPKKLKNTRTNLHLWIFPSMLFMLLYYTSLDVLKTNKQFYQYLKHIFFFFFNLKREVDSLDWKTLFQSIQKEAGILNENFNNGSQDSMYGFLLHMTNLATLLPTAHLSNSNKSERNCQRKILFRRKKADMISACIHFVLVLILYSEL